MKKLVAMINGNIHWQDMGFSEPYSYYLYEGGWFGRSCKFLGPYNHMKKEIAAYQRIVEPWLMGGSLPDWAFQNKDGVWVMDLTK